MTAFLLNLALCVLALIGCLTVITLFRIFRALWTGDWT